MRSIAFSCWRLRGPFPPRLTSPAPAWRRSIVDGGKLALSPDGGRHRGRRPGRTAAGGGGRRRPRRRRTGRRLPARLCPVLDRRRARAGRDASRSAARATGDDKVVLDMALSCPRSTGTLSIRDDWPEVMGAHFQTVLSVRQPGRPSVEFAFLEDRRAATLDLATATRHRLVRASSPWAIEHILGGIDHLLFLLALLALARGFWQTVTIVTGFTVAHSITLSLAALGVIDVPSRIVEPLIAASIVWVARREPCGAVGHRPALADRRRSSAWSTAWVSPRRSTELDLSRAGAGAGADRLQRRRRAGPDRLRDRGHAAARLGVAARPPAAPAADPVGPRSRGRARSGWSCAFSLCEQRRALALDSPAQCCGVWQPSLARPRIGIMVSHIGIALAAGSSPPALAAAASLRVPVPAVLALSREPSSCVRDLQLAESGPSVRAKSLAEIAETARPYWLASIRCERIILRGVLAVQSRECWKARRAEDPGGILMSLIRLAAAAALAVSRGAAGRRAGHSQGAVAGGGGLPRRPG